MICVVPPPAKESKPATEAPAKPKPNLEEEVREMKLGLLKKFKDQDKEIFQNLLTEYSADLSDYIPFWIFKLSLLEGEKEEGPQKVLETAAEVIKRIDAGELAKYFGLKQPEKPDLVVKKRMEDQKTYLIEALKKTALAQFDLSSGIQNAEEKAVSDLYHCFYTRIVDLMIFLSSFSSSFLLSEMGLIIRGNLRGTRQVDRTDRCQLFDPIIQQEAPSEAARGRPQGPA